MNINDKLLKLLNSDKRIERWYISTEWCGKEEDVEELTIELKDEYIFGASETSTEHSDDLNYMEREILNDIIERC